MNSTLRDLSSLHSLDVRVANHPDDSGVSFDLMIADKKGKSAKLLTSLTSIESFPWSGNVYPRIQARTLRGSIQSVKSKVDLKQIAAVILVSKSASGHVWIVDIAASQALIQMPTDLNLPELSLETATVMETDGFKRYTLKILSDRPLTSRASVWIESLSNGFENRAGYQLDLVPSSSTVAGQIVVEHAGDYMFSSPNFYQFYLVAVKGVITA